MSAPRRSAVGSRSARPVAMAKRNTAPIVLRARVAVSCRPRFSILRKASRISGHLISAIVRLPNSLLAKSSSQRFFFRVVGASPSASNFLHQFLGHGLKRIGPCDPRIPALFLAIDGGIDAFGQQLFLRCPA